MSLLMQKLHNTAVKIQWSTAQNYIKISYLKIRIPIILIGVDILNLGITVKRKIMFLCYDDASRILKILA